MLNDVRENDCRIRVVSIYSTSWRYRGKAHEDLGARLELGGLKRHYELYRDQLPRLLPFDLLGGRICELDDLRLDRPVDGIRIDKVDALL